ncbi:hypothetical protein NKDENANG_03642 [Candidatus Entotheonellaceae bacterium PAL068K]
MLTRTITYAVQLSGTDGGTIMEALRTSPIRLGEGALGRAAVTREPVQIPDVLSQAFYPERLRSLLGRHGFRAILAVPLLREEHIVGGLVVRRKVPGEFPPQLVDLVQNLCRPIDSCYPERPVVP